MLAGLAIHGAIIWLMIRALLFIYTYLYHRVNTHSYASAGIPCDDYDVDDDDDAATDAKRACIIKCSSHTRVRPVIKIVRNWLIGRMPARRKVYLYCYKQGGGEIYMFALRLA